MANKKFSDFTLKTDSANVDFVVGYDGSDNVRIAPSNLGGGATDLNGLSDVLIDGTSNYFVNIPSGLSGNPVDNLVIGNGAGNALTTGTRNVVLGKGAMDVNTDGNDNIAIGHDALAAETGGDRNVAIGAQALIAQNQTFASQNVAIGYAADDGNLTGNFRVCIGGQAGHSSATGTNVINIGYNSNEGSSSAANVVTLGNSDIATLRCQVTSITALSDERDKTSIEDLPYGLDFINSLQPKKFVWDNREETDKYGNTYTSSRKGAKDIGFIAQELQSVDDDFLNLVYDENPDKLEATYGRLVPVLVKAIQDLSAKVTALENA